MHHRDDTDIEGPKRSLQSITTIWEDIYRFQTEISEKDRHGLMSYLASRYWKPLYYVARVSTSTRRALSNEDAKDAVQEFFARNFFADLLSRVDEGKSTSGFRGFLRASWENFLHNRQRDLRRKRRSPAGGVLPISIPTLDGNDRFTFEPSTNVTADQIYDRRFCLDHVERALNRLRTGDFGQECRFYEDFCDHWLAGKTYEELAKQRNLSVDRVKIDMQRMQRRFRKLMFEEFGIHATSEAEIRNEINEAMGMLLNQSDFF